MAIYHCRVKVVGRKGGRSIISASAYRNASKMHDKETGLNYDYSRKRNVVYSEILYCENAPEGWKEVTDEEIETFKKSTKYKKASDKEAAIEWFKIQYQKERLWNEVIKIENYSNAQFAREFELALPYECSREESIQLVHDYVQNYLVNDGMCADIAIHNPDKETKNPHAHVLVTMRPIKENGQWAPKETKEYALDESGNRIPVIDPETGEQKLGKRNEKMWKRVTVQKNYWNSEEKLLEWREGWATECNKYLSPENHIDHRSNKKRGIDRIATIHEGYAARKMEEQGQTSWVCELNREIKHANTESKVLELRTNWAIKDLAELKNEMEEENYVSIRGKERRADEPAGRESDNEGIVEPGFGTEGNNNRPVERTERRTELIVRSTKAISKCDEIGGIDGGIVQLERAAEQRERKIAWSAQVAARPNAGTTAIKQIGDRTGEVETIGIRIKQRERVSGNAVTRTRSSINKSAEGLPERTRSVASRTRGILGARIVGFAEKFREFVEEAVYKIQNRIEELKVATNKYYDVVSHGIDPGNEVPENKTIQNNKLNKGKKR